MSIDKKKSCNCHSHNGEFGETPNVLVSRSVPVSGGGGQMTSRDIAIDACIANVIDILWKNNIDTGSSCCGHGVNSPMIVLGEEEERYSFIKDLIAEVDGGEFLLVQWKKVVV